MSDGALRAALRAEIEKSYGRDPDIWRGDDWWQMADDEAAVFELDPAALPRLAVVWEWYTAFMGTAAGGDWPDDLIEAARATSADLFAMGECDESWIEFAWRFGRVQPAQAVRMRAKVYWWEVRRGLWQFKDRTGADEPLFVDSLPF